MSLRSLILSLPAIIYLPHGIIFGLSPAVLKAEISEDVRVNTMAGGGVMLIHRDLPVSVCTLMQALNKNKYLRTLFFHRIKNNRLCHFLWGKMSTLEIPYDVIIGAGLKLDHPFSTIINAKSIGVNCRIKNNTTIGNKNDNEQLRPVIGNNVYIGAGAIVIGNITIGNNVTIGAGAVVVKSIPDNCTVVGNPARIINK